MVHARTLLGVEMAVIACCGMLRPADVCRAQGLDPFAGTDAGARSLAAPDSHPATTMPSSGTLGPTLQQVGPIIDQVQCSNEDIDTVFQIVSDRSGWSIVPSAKVRGKVSLYAKNISAGSLLDEAVRMAGFVYVRQGNVISVMTYEEYMQYYGVVKQVFRLQQRDAEEVTRLLTGFVTPRGKLVPDSLTRSLVIYEVPSNLPMLEAIIRQIDVAADPSVIETIKVVYADVDELGEQLRQIYDTARKDDQPKLLVASSQPSVATGIVLGSGGRSVTILPISRTNHLVLKGYRQDLLQVRSLIESLDVAPDFMETRVYPVKNLPAADLVESLERALGVGTQQQGGYASNRSPMQYAGQSSSRMGGSGTQSRRISVAVLDENNALVVTAPGVVHRQAAAFLQVCDVPPLQVAGGIQVYKLDNTDAAEVAQILQQLVEQGGPQNERGKMAIANGQAGPRNIGPSQQAPSPPPAAGSPSLPAGSAGDPGQAAAFGAAGGSGERWVEKPRIAAQVATNSVIIQASAQYQAQFSQLIKQMDRRRTQVLLEIVVAEITGTDDVDVGFEYEHADKADGEHWGHLVFTSFGLSTLDPTTNQRTVAVLPGGSAAVIRTDYVPVIMHALRNTGKGKIRTAPRMLVNDNAKGMLQSITEKPYKQVNASDTVATTSFGGYVQAGTDMQVIPHISESDYLMLEYQITLNSFLEQSDPDLPPGRETNLATSQATVPDGDTLIVGGLTYRKKNEVFSRLPLLGDIPLVGRLFGRTITSQDDVRIYIFVTPTILRDNQFRDLKSISEQQRQESKEPSAYPMNAPLELNGE